MGRYIGDIKESDLIPLWNNKRVVSFDNPTDAEEQKVIDAINNNSMNYDNSCNWSIVNDNDKGIFDKLVKIIIEEYTDEDYLSSVMY